MPAVLTHDVWQALRNMFAIVTSIY